MAVVPIGVGFQVPKRNWRNDSTKALRIGQRGGETLPAFILAAGEAKSEREVLG